MELSASTVAFISCRGRGLSLQLMKATVLAETASFIRFHRDLSAPAMPTQMNQVGITLFPSF